MGVFHGAIAIIRKDGSPIGKMRNIRWTENIGRADVRGLGTILTSEVPAVSWGGTGSCDFYEVDFTTTGVPGVIRRDVQTNQQFEDQLVLDTTGVTIDIFKKVEDLLDPNTGLKTAKAIPYATLTQVFLESDGADVTEGALAGHNQSFRYLGPVLRRS